MLSGEVAKRYGHKGLPDDTIAVTLTGTAGQSFGAFLARGVSFDLQGDGNDYVGKGLSGGRIVVRPPENSRIVAEQVDHRRQHRALRRDRGRVLFPRRRRRALRRAQLGRHRRRRGRRRPWLRIHDRRHRRVIGETGRNFAAGMSGGIAYVLDETGDFAQRCNMAMVELEPVPEEDDLLEKLHHHGGDLAHKGRVDVSSDMNHHDEERLYQLISNHMHYTGSKRAKEILDNWADFRPKFVKVMPVEYRRALQEMEACATVRRRRSSARAECRLRHKSGRIGFADVAGLKLENWMRR